MINNIYKNKYNYKYLKDKLDDIDLLLDKLLILNSELKQLEKDKKKYTQKYLKYKSKCQVLSYYIC